jgi:hypothetical protein
MNRPSTRRRSKLLTLAPLYGVPAGLLAAFLALASAHGPEGLANTRDGVREPELMSLASLATPAVAGPGRRIAMPTPAAAPAKAVAAVPRARVAPAEKACPSAVRHVLPAPAAPVPPAAPSAPNADLDAAVALVGPTIEDLGEPAPDACAGMALPIEAPQVDGVSECLQTLQVVNVSAMSIEARREWAKAARAAVARAIAARRPRQISGAI